MYSSQGTALLIQGVTASWTQLLLYVIEQRKAIIAANTECQPPAELNTQQWLLAEKVIKLLKVFEEAMWEVSREYASASVIMPIIRAPKKIFQKMRMTMVLSIKRGMLKSIQDWYGSVDECYIMPAG